MFTTLDSFDTEFPADSVECCPVNEFHRVIACGTYLLVPPDDKKSQPSHSDGRIGKVHLLLIDANGKLTSINNTNVPAVFDMKWANARLCDKVLLGVANSSGSLQMFQLENDVEEKPKLSLIDEIKIAPEDTTTMALSLDWSIGKWSDDMCQDSNIVGSYSNGAISLFKLDGEGFKEITSWSAHQFETWTAAFDYWNSNVIYSGGDDCKFQRFDTRVGSKPTNVNRSHTAGVTSIRSDPFREFSLTTGSYDETLRFWDTRKLRAPLGETVLGGGIWRIKWDPFDRERLLTACMYGGFKVVDCKRPEVPIVHKECLEHGSIAYGCDWSFIEPEKSSHEALIVTCSFYNHLLRSSLLSMTDVESINSYINKTEI
ncbi:diphthine methyltransferase [Orussus abietinus]|uniref:diphthine methyltransferase n=1 Tax=Orussus abietinus TaxID=222816 RepID=UPI000626A099|nr:diphthine methyltransferase [Orussus abietinus]XP_012271684.1 diphthine methyltransferase [Orussus abietinus]